MGRWRLTFPLGYASPAVWATNTTFSSMTTPCLTVHTYKYIQLLVYIGIIHIHTYILSSADALNYDVVTKRRNSNISMVVVSNSTDPRGHMHVIYASIVIIKLYMRM